MKKRIAVFRGGPSSEYDISLLSGAAVLEALTASGYDCTDVIVSRTGDWLTNGRRQSPAQILQATDVVFIALHGTYGEDGQIQRILEQYGTPFTGSRAFPSSVAFHKPLTKQRVAEIGIQSPRSVSLRRHHLTDPRFLTRVHTDLGMELFIKPARSGSSDGSRRVTEADDIYNILHQLIAEYDELLIEECITGIEATVGVLEQFRGEDYYALPVVEIIPPSDVGYFDRTVKYNGQTKEIVPATFSPQLRDQLQTMATQAHQHLGTEQYSRSDFLITDSGIYFLELNTLPGLTSESLFPKAAAAVGLSFPDLVRHLVETAR